VALFGSSKNKKDSGSSELVLAYLEEAQRVKGPLFLTDSRKAELPAVVQGLDEDGGTVTFSLMGPFLADKGFKVTMLLFAESTRLMGVGKLLETRGSTVVMEIPESLSLVERRQQARVRLNPKEGATVTALTGLFDGIGVNGILENLSESGCRLRVEKAINLKDERRLPLGTALMPPGQPLMLVKVNKVPRCPAVIELSGKVAYLSDNGGSLSMGIVFEKPRVDAAAAIRSLVSMRASALPSAVPPKARRKAQEAETSLLPDAEAHRAEVRREASVKESVTETPAPVAIEEPVQPEDSPVAEAVAPPRNLALLRLKKRARTILILAPGAHGDLVRDFLLEDGYGKVLLTGNLNELESMLEHQGIGLVFIDTNMPMLECMEFVARQGEEHHNMPPVILAAEEVSRSMVMVAHRSGVSHLLVKPYALDETLSALLEQQLGI